MNTLSKKTMLIIALCLLCMTAFSENIHLFNDDFDEGGGSMWHFENGTQTNRWVVGSATYTGTGGKSAYISNDNGTSNIYTISGATSVVHLYVDITFPACAGGMLSFDWKSYGQSSYDVLTVSILEDTITPVAGTAITNVIATIGTYYGKSEWQHVDYTFPTTYSNVTKRLVFSWKNNASSGTQPPAAIDNVHIEVFPLISKTVHLADAGTLKDTPGIADATTLKIMGNMDARDVKFMRDNIARLVHLDLSEANILEYTGTGGTYIYSSEQTYPANTMPKYSFYGSSSATYKTSLKSVILPKTVICIANSAFRNCTGLNDVSFPRGLKILEPYAFTQCLSLTDIKLPVGLSTISSYAFATCNIVDCVIPEGVTTVGQEAFSSNSAMKTVSLPESFTTLGTRAFGYNESITTIITRNLTPPALEASVFNSVNKTNCTLIVPNSAVNIYANTQYWNQFKNIVGGGIALSLNINNPVWGEIAAETNSGLYPEGTRIRLVANPFYPLCTFLNWTDQYGTENNSANLDFILTGNTSLKANFTNSSLKSLSVSYGSLTPDFDPAVTNYTLSVPHPVNTISIDAVSEHDTAKVTGNGTHNLETGNNTMEVIVEVEHGITKTYTVHVNRAEALQVPFKQEFEDDISDWITENGNQTNQWIWGTATASTGDKSVFISNDGVNNAYTTNYDGSLVHFYCDVYFTPSDGNYKLSFDWKGVGLASTWDEDYHYMSVHLVETSVNPVAGTGLSLATQLGTFRRSDVWQRTEIALSGAYSGTIKRLVFTWVNSNLTAGQPPIAIDNVAVTGADILKTPFISDFENSSHKWTVSNGAQYNQWVRGTATAASGENSFYISDDGVNNHYNRNVSKVHLYGDVYFSPSSEDYQLSFDYKGHGRSSDKLSAYVIETTSNPVAGNVLTNPVWEEYINTDTWKNTSVSLPKAYSGTEKRIVFTWVNWNEYNNPESTGQPPAAIDNISVQSQGTSGISSVEENMLSIFPNPVRDELRIKISETTFDVSQLREGKTVRIYNIAGQNVLNSQLSTLNSINVSHLPAGVYIVRICTDKGVADKKLIKE